jgi:hypothetical protein
MYLSIKRPVPACDEQGVGLFYLLIQTQNRAIQAEKEDMIEKIILFRAKCAPASLY